MKKGFYFIVTNQEDKDGKIGFVPDLQEGTFEYHSPLFVHRAVHLRGSTNWKVSHIDSGSNVTALRTLQEARAIAKDLKHLSLWEHKSHKGLTAAISKPEYEEEVKLIKKRLGLI